MVPVGLYYFPGKCVFSEKSWIKRFRRAVSNSITQMILIRRWWMFFLSALKLTLKVSSLKFFSGYVQYNVRPHQRKKKVSEFWDKHILAHPERQMKDGTLCLTLNLISSQRLRKNGFVQILVLSFLFSSLHLGVQINLFLSLSFGNSSIILYLQIIWMLSWVK